MQQPMILDLDNVKYHHKFSGNNCKIFGDLSTLQVLCEYDPRVGKLQQKVERSGYDEQEREDIYNYNYDRDGRLLEVERNHRPTEKYWYNDWGQRFCRETWPEGACDYYVYAKDDSLKCAGRSFFEYDQRGNTIISQRGKTCTRYSYRQGVLLERVVLPEGQVIEYVYDKGVLPRARYRDGTLTQEYQWRLGSNTLARVPFLTVCRDHEQGLDFNFKYSGRHCPELVRISKFSAAAEAIWEKLCARMGDSLGVWSNGQKKKKLRQASSLDFYCGCDQVGSLKRLSDSRHYEIKYINYDSFGNVIEDSLPELRLPLAFAGGLRDCDTGLVRFGCRDYNPLLGRFLCPDPLGDTGGDHDLYDYCVDDPVGNIDPNGLFSNSLWPKQPVMGVNPFLAYDLGWALANLGLHGAAWITDKAGEWYYGKSTTAARDGVNEGMDKAKKIFRPFDIGAGQ